MIKLVVSDIDGTLIPEGTHKPPNELAELVCELTNHGIVFVVASGRQYKSMHKVFEACADRVIFVACNGTYIRKGTKDVREHHMNKTLLEHLILDLRKWAEQGYCYMAESKDTAYVEVKDKEFQDMLVKGYHYEITVVDDILKECDDVMKISLFHKEDIQRAVDWMIPKWEGRLNVLRSGANWIDFMEAGIDKGNAIGEIQQELNIVKEETIVFGDNVNDVGMFSKAACSYAVETASWEVKEQADKIAGAPKDMGVIKILQEVLKDIQGKGE